MSSVAAVKRIITLCLYIVLAAVILSEIRTVWIGLTDPGRFANVFPGATGPMYYLAVTTSACAGLNAIAVWLRQRWAIWMNVFIGVWSIVLVHIMGGPVVLRSLSFSRLPRF
jgi:hypothetical protein